MNPVLKEILETGNTKLVDGGVRDISDAAISSEEGELITRCINDIGAEVAIETGLAYGVSALYICDALKKTDRTKHIVIDPYQMPANMPWANGVGLKNLYDAGYKDIVEFVEESSHLCLPAMEKDGLKIDFGFIDGNHLYDYAFLDFFYMDRMLKVGGIIVFDDTNWPAIRSICSFLLANRNYRVYDYIEVPESHLISPKRKVVNSVFESLAGKDTLSKYFKPQNQFYGAEIDRVCHGACVAFIKEADDSRNINQFTPF